MAAQAAASTPPATATPSYPLHVAFSGPTQLSYWPTLNLFISNQHGDVEATLSHRVSNLLAYTAYVASLEKLQGVDDLRISLEGMYVGAKGDGAAYVERFVLSDFDEVHTITGPKDSGTVDLYLSHPNPFASGMPEWQIKNSAAFESRFLTVRDRKNHTSSSTRISTDWFLLELRGNGAIRESFDEGPLGIEVSGRVNGRLEASHTRSRTKEIFVSGSAVANFKFTFGLFEPDYDVHAAVGGEGVIRVIDGGIQVTGTLDGIVTDNSGNILWQHGVQPE